MSSVPPTAPKALDGLPPFAWRAVAPALLAMSVALLLTAGRYGYHRDELYFRMLPPAWGYVDHHPSRRSSRAAWPRCTTRWSCSGCPPCCSPSSPPAWSSCSPASSAGAGGGGGPPARGGGV